MEWILNSEEDTLKLGRQLALASECRGLFYLEGSLGSGKTTLSRGILRGFKYEGKVPSPTWTLVEPYELDSGCVYHFDLYRLGAPEELDLLGAREYFSSRSLCLVEWPDKGEGSLPDADLRIRMDWRPEGRHVSITPVSQHGHAVCSRLQAHYVA
ncbi:MAG: tRNA (adenosine(37)-N6)-threonylcarbamoyltransferase complex ATPase subunit type 1 TsaE [Kistimonas sp.]|nr:tRNA (adenosine(37)-N6)-threonylcarbamoyltransferase complex ATPase subunit type 1 TsaE [Kistimonas sp.]